MHEIAPAPTEHLFGDHHAEADAQSELPERRIGRDKKGDQRGGDNTVKSRPETPDTCEDMLPRKGQADRDQQPRCELFRICDKRGHDRDDHAEQRGRGAVGQQGAADAARLQVMEEGDRIASSNSSSVARNRAP